MLNSRRSMSHHVAIAEEIDFDIVLPAPHTGFKSGAAPAAPTARNV
jgi:hypothetical protein